MNWSSAWPSLRGRIKQIFPYLPKEQVIQESGVISHDDCHDSYLMIILIYLLSNPLMSFTSCVRFLLLEFPHSIRTLVSEAADDRFVV